mmetsp:Transcript_52207/g.124953  ORF Transcript_52207/g.124953 Transcript_52207/m.124953 type:complete len:412 (+) Transcript_52207:881-2116(+)
MHRRGALRFGVVPQLPARLPALERVSSGGPASATPAGAHGHCDQAHGAVGVRHPSAGARGALGSQLLGAGAAGGESADPGAARQSGHGHPQRAGRRSAAAGDHQSSAYGGEPNGLHHHLRLAPRDGGPAGQTAPALRQRRDLRLPRQHAAGGAERGAGQLHGRQDPRGGGHSSIWHGPGQAGHPHGAALWAPQIHRELHPRDWALRPRRAAWQVHRLGLPKGLPGHALAGERWPRGWYQELGGEDAASSAAGQLGHLSAARAEQRSARCCWWPTGRLRGRRLSALLRGLRREAGLQGAERQHRRAALGAGAPLEVRGGLRVGALQLPHEAEAPVLQKRPPGAHRHRPPAAPGVALGQEGGAGVHPGHGEGGGGHGGHCGPAVHWPVASARGRVLGREGRVRLHGGGTSVGE